MESNVDSVVEIKSREAAENAIKMLDRSEFRGRKIIVREVMEIYKHCFHEFEVIILFFNQIRKGRRIG